MTIHSSKTWILASPKPEEALRLAQEHALSPLLAQVLINRHIEPQKVSQFLHPSFQDLPDPLSMLGMEQALACLVPAVLEGKKITIYGDYDVDGCTSTALLMDFFEQVGAKVDYYIPHRVREGYSLNPQALQHLKKQGTEVIITVDNGISAVDSARLAQELNLKLIITDHHELPPDLPVATAILNPKLHQDNPWGKELAGVGVAFYLAMGLRRALREKGHFAQKQPDLKKLLDLVALGTIADMAPLRDLNRLLVKEGLKVLAQSQRPGLQALKEICGYAAQGKVKASQVSFQLAPRLNAVGRLQEASLGVELLLSRDLKEASSLARRLDQANQDRRALESKMTTEAVARIEEADLLKNYQSLVLLGEDWHQGVVGIVASRLVERYYLPSIVLTRDEAGLKGSARSIRGFSMVEALQACSQYLNKFGGHAYAAGLSMDLKHLADFQKAFDQEVRARLKAEDFKPALVLDAELSLSQIDSDFLDQLKLLEPCGLGNPEALFYLSKASIKNPRVLGQEHLKMKLSQEASSQEAIAFGQAQQEKLADHLVDAALIPQWNEWRGQKTIQLRVLGLKKSS